jgi:tetratricopeptide (TPR) repeat protein
VEEVVQEEVGTLYEEAVSLYEQEKYEQALHKLDRLLLKDRTNEDALTLHQQVGRAWKLAEVIKKEEARHRAAEPPPVPVQQPVIPLGGKDSDFWGPTDLPEASDDSIVVTGTPVPVRRPQVPVADRIVARVSKVHLPVRPILIGIASILVAVIGYKIVDAVLHAVVPPDRILCVYPPAVTDGGTDGQGMADAFAEDLILDLGSVQAIHVVAPPTALATRQRTTRPVRMAQSFGAEYVLLWNLAVHENTFSGSVTLMDTLHAQPVWQGRLESPMQELPRHRRELARKILQVMDVDISGTDTPLAQNASASSGAGYQFYLKGRAALQSGDVDAVNLALTAFQQAVRGDSLDGNAWGALGWTHILAGEQAFTPARTTVPVALASVERAISLGARKAETFRTWGVAEMLNGNYAKGAVRLEEAVEASPSDAEALRRLATLETLRGNTDDALHSAIAAAEVDPLNATSHLTVGLIHQFRGEFAEAEACYRRATAEDREHPDAAELHAEVLVYLQRADDALANVTEIAARLRTDPAAYYKVGRIAQTGGRPKAEWTSAFERSRTLLEKQLQVKPDSALALSLYALTQTRLGAFRDAATALQRALTLAPDDFRILYNAARMYALQRDKEQAMTYLTQAIDLRYDLRKILDMDLFNLRADQEFLRSVTR